MKRWQKVDRYILCILAGAMAVLLFELTFYIGRHTAPIQAALGALQDL